MRSKHRIQNFIEKVNWFKLLHNQWNLFNSEYDARTFSALITERIPKIKKYWEENPDLRISQVLIALEIIGNTPGIWFYDECYTILIEQGIAPEECLFWTSVFDKDENRLDEPITKLIKDLDKDHIHAIRAYNDKRKTFLPPHYVEAFNNVMKK